MYCESKNLVFVHVPKAAGSTIELLLEPYADPKAVKLIKRPPELYAWEDDVEVHVKQRGILHTKHWTLLEHIRNWMLDPGKITSFAVVRNPYERMIKVFLFKLQNGEFLPKPREPGYEESLQQPRGKHISEAVLNNWSHRMFEEFLSMKRDIARMSLRTFLSASAHCCIQDKLAVNYILKYENLQEDLSDFFKLMDIPLPQTLPVTNSTHPINEDQLKSLYNYKTQRIVDDLWRRDFENFGYEKWKKIT